MLFVMCLSLSNLVALSGKLKEWTLNLYGTSEHPYQSHGSQHSRARMLEVPSVKSPEPTPSTALQNEDEEEEEYTGTNDVMKLFFFILPSEGVNSEIRYYGSYNIAPA